MNTSDNNMTPYEIWQLSRYGDIIPSTTEQPYEEMMADEERRMAEWTELQNEIQLIEEDHF